MTSYHPPHIHWFPAGDHAELYLHDADHDQWTRIDLATGTLHPGQNLPPDSQQLFTWDQVDNGLDSYRALLDAGLGTSRQGMFDLDRIHQAAEVVAAVEHSDLKDVIFQELHCPQD